MIGSRVAAVGVAALLSQCAPGPPPGPQHGPAIYCDISQCNPERVTFAVWGAPGFVEAQTHCRTSYRANWSMVADSGAIWFTGGGNSYQPGRYITVRCQPNIPYVWRGSEFAWGWP
jgi:hypothetical protein